MLISQRNLIGRFRDAGATVPAAARTLDELEVRATMMFSRLGRAGVFVHAGGERWWLDAAAWERFERRQGRRMLLATVAILAVCALAVAVRMLW